MKEILEAKLDQINKDLNGIIGRLTLYRQIPVIKEAHELAIKLGNDVDNLINELPL